MNKKWQQKNRSWCLKILDHHTSECAGLTYQLEFADQWETYELLFVSHEVTIGVSPKVHPLVDGAVIDFLLEGQDAGFIVRNPNIKSQCGCGESFYV
jgi:iron-sulfur cluster assembly protein